MEEKKVFSITGHFKWFALVSLLLTIVGLIGLIGAPFGLGLFNMDIDFAGGTTIYIELGQTYDDTARDTITGIFKEQTQIEPSSIQTSGGDTQILIKSKEITTDVRQKVFDAIKEQYPQAELLQTENVSASVGDDLKSSAFLATLIAGALMLVYITIRFEFKSGLAAVICLVHDLLVMLSVYIIFQIPLNMNFIAAMLTILGYSINASIIVFDRIRENMRFARKEGFNEVVDRSIWQTMPRTVNTSLTTLFMILMILIFAVPSLQNFALPITVGVISGAYSSAFLAGPLWNLLRGKKKAKV